MSGDCLEERGDCVEVREKCVGVRGDFEEVR